MKNNVKLMELEARIEVLEKELRNLKEEVEVLKATEVTDTTTTESVATEETKTNVEAKDVFATTIEELNLNVIAFKDLKRAGIKTLGDIANLSEEELSKAKKRLGMHAFEVIEKVRFLSTPELLSNWLSETKKAAEAKKVKEEQERQLALKLSKNFVAALEVYAKFEEQANKEGITWYHLDGMFHCKFLQLRHLKSFTIVKDIFDERPILNSYYCLECMNGEHPRMFELLTSDEDKISVDMIKAAVLEDFRESNRSLGKNSKTYQYALRFIEIVKAYEE